MLKILFLPAVAILSLAVLVLSFLAVLVLSFLAVLVLSFLAVCATAVLKFLSVPVALLGAGVAILTDPVAGLLIIAGAFLISPFGLPKLANWLLDRMAGLNIALRNFVIS